MVNRNFGIDCAIPIHYCSGSTAESKAVASENNQYAVGIKCSSLINLALGPSLVGQEQPSCFSGQIIRRSWSKVSGL
jgi:hypothetical protein